jgi:Flp pilus assembly protein TadB
MIAWWCCGVMCGAGVAVGTLPGFGSRMIGELRGFTKGIERQVERLTSGNTEKDLAMCNRTVSELVAQKLAFALVGGMIGALVAALLTSVVGSVAGPITVAAGLVGAIGGFAVPDLALRSTAARIRRDFIHSFSGFLDLVNVLLAGGAGLETALVAAADAGDGPAFERLRWTLSRARTFHQSPWEELHDLGERLGISQLSEVAGSLQLAGEHGARVRSSLAARADALRFRQMSEIEATANSSTERMGLPMVMLFLGFLVLIGYPAVTYVIGGL